MISVSYLTHIYHDKRTQLPSLHQSLITDWRHYLDFAEFAEDFIGSMTYPHAQACKTETYGFCPTLFMPGEDRQGRHGHWRRGELAADVVTLLIMDCDNAQPEEPQITLEEAGQGLDDLGLSYLLYTSYSHTAEKHKFRLILPVERDLSYDEAYDAARWFNQRLHNQFDLSIYSPGDYLYCPPHDSEFLINLEGKPVSPEVVTTGLPPRPPAQYTRTIPNPEARAKLKLLSGDPSVREWISLQAPSLCRPEWLTDHAGLYKDGSHAQTLKGTLTRIWLRSRATLTAGEMQNLARELDAYYGGYVQRKYGRYEIDRAINDIMTIPTTEILNHSAPPRYSARVAANILKKKRRNV